MTRIADYDQLQPVGSDNHGQFYVAPAPPRLGLPDADVVVKVFDRHVDDDSFAKIVRELKVYACAYAETLGKIYEVGRQGTRFFVVMEHFTGGSLAQGGLLDLATAVRALADAARAAHALHDVGLVHREIRPAAIMRADGRAKLVDPSLQHVVAPGRTVSGLSLESVETLEPALVRGEGANRASDVWSLGATLHFVLTGAPVLGELPADSLLKVLHHVMTAPVQLSPHLDPRVRPVIERCVAQDRRHRFGTAAELATALEGIAA